MRWAAGCGEPPPRSRGLAQIDYFLTAASATTSLGVLLLGATIPGLWPGRAPRVVVAIVLLAVSLVLFAAYLAPRWLTQPRAESVADRVIPILRPWSRVLGLLLPARTATRPHRPPIHLAGGRRRRAGG